MLDIDSIAHPLRSAASAGSNMATVTSIVIHCSATPPNGYVNNAYRIHRLHVDSNGWDAIGYHYVIGRDGSIEGGRPTHRTGAGVRGHNAGSIHVCLIGGLNAENAPTGAEYTRHQWLELSRLVRALEIKFPLVAGNVIGHRDIDPMKACPCFGVAEWYRMQEIGEAPLPTSIVADINALAEREAGIKQGRAEAHKMLCEKLREALAL